MALEKNAPSGMPTKQKVIMAVVVIVFLVVIWQVVGLMGWGSGSSSTTIKPVANQNAAHTAPAAAMTGATPAPANPTQPAQAPEVKQATIMNDPQFIQQQQMNEQKYLGKINDLEDLKIQRAIAETNQAIAIAKLATVTAEKNISDLLTKPVVQEIPPAAYANKLANPNGQSENPAGIPQIPTVQVDYSVISVSMQLGKWSAVIGAQGKLYSVVTGDVLSPDNSVVTSISKNGVTLRKNGVSRKISIMSAI